MKIRALLAALLCATSAGAQASATSSIGGLVGTIRLNGGRTELRRDVTVILLAGDKIVATTRTDATGRYHIDGIGDGSYRLVAVVDGVRALVDVTVAGKAVEQPIVMNPAKVEEIDIYEKTPVEVPARPKGTWLKRILPYPDEAIESDRWGLAIVLAYIDEYGRVVLARLVHPAGYGFDAIALDQVFHNSFEPARDPGGRRMRSTAFVRVEWPAFWWLGGFTAVAPKNIDVSHVPCEGSGPLAFPTLGDNVARPCVDKVPPADVAKAAFHFPSSPMVLEPAAFVATLDDAARQRLCDWTVELTRPYGKAEALTVDACLARLAEAAGCGKSVESVVSCTVDHASDPAVCAACPTSARPMGKD